IRGGAQDDLAVAQEVCGVWRFGTGRSKAGAQGRGRQAQGLASGCHLQPGPRPPPGAVEAALRVVDIGGGSTTDYQQVWCQAFGSVGSAVSAGVGGFPPEARSSGLWKGAAR